MLATRIVLAAVVAAISVTPLAAGEVIIAREPKGLRAAAISVYVATPEPVEDPDKIRIRYGELDAIRWELGTLPVLDVQVLISNTSKFRIASLDVQLSVYVGQGALVDAPALEGIRSGGPGITEKLFFERTFELEDVGAGMLARLDVPEIGLRTMVMNLLRQKLWPSYIMMVATISEPTGEVHVSDEPATYFLRMEPALPDD